MLKIIFILALLFLAQDVYAKDPVECLAENIYHEARGESVEGQKAVGYVTLHRVASKRFPDDVCGVVWQSKQFSWTISPPKVKNLTAWMHARRVAKYVLDNPQDSNVGNADHYYAASGRNGIKPPYWAKYETKVVTIGNHRFMELTK